MAAPGATPSASYTTPPGHYRVSLGRGPPLRKQDIHLPQLRDDLLGLVPPPGHSFVLHPARKPYIREDHFSGGRPPPRGAPSLGATDDAAPGGIASWRVGDREMRRRPRLGGPPRRQIPACARETAALATDSRGQRHRRMLGEGEPRTAGTTTVKATSPDAQALQPAAARQIAGAAPGAAAQGGAGDAAGRAAPMAATTTERSRSARTRPTPQPGREPSRTMSP